MGFRVQVYIYIYIFFLVQVYIYIYIFFFSWWVWARDFDKHGILCRAPENGRDGVWEDVGRIVLREVYRSCGNVPAYA